MLSNKCCNCAAGKQHYLNFNFSLPFWRTHICTYVFSLSECQTIDMHRYIAKSVYELLSIRLLLLVSKSNQQL